MQHRENRRDMRTLRLTKKKDAASRNILGTLQMANAQLSIPDRLALDGAFQLSSERVIPQRA